MRKIFTLTLVLFLFLNQPLFARQDEMDFLDEFETSGNYIEVFDPLESLNRVFFQFNDKLYTYVLTPVAETYDAVLPDDIRGCIANAFKNLLSPVRVVNSLLQGNVAQSGIELLRFVVNTTAGAGGLGDPAKEVFDLRTTAEDFGQTLGKYGIGDGIYICWPIFGPSNIRDTIGRVGDSFLDPLSYVFFENTRTGLAVHAGKRVNKTSLVLGEYEHFIESSFDPYIAMRDFYTESRRSKILNKHTYPSAFPNMISFYDVVNPVSDDLAISSDKGEENGQSARVVSKKYFIQVGVFTDKENLNELAQRLLTIDKEPVIVKYIRDDYNFYGIQVQGGNEFAMAKVAEQELIDAGFKETSVLVR